MRARRFLLVLVVLVVLVVVVPGGLVLALKLNEAQRAVRRALREAAARYGLDPEALDVIGAVEGPRWKLDARSKDPRDEARGGSFGPTQISQKTARLLGYSGDMEAFRRDAALAAEWTARILADSHKRRPLHTLADYVAAWNAGKDDADKNDDGGLEELPATHPTRATYLPAAYAALALVRVTPVA